MLQGKPDSILFSNSIEGPNNFQRIVRYGENMLDKALKQTLNSSIAEIGQKAKDIPKDLTQSIICFKPNLIRVLREKQARENRSDSKRQIRLLLKRSGKF